MMILVLVIGCAIVFGCEASPRPCPQFLPVAVRLEQPPPYILKRVSATKTENENVIAINIPDYSTKDDRVVHNNNYVTSPELLLIRRQNPQQTSQELTSPKIESTTEKINLENDLLIDSNFLPKRSRPGLHKRKSTTKKDSDINKIILTENSSWMLKTINNQPADEVLVTDKASIAHDLQNSTESALVLVHKLDEEM